MTYKWYVNTNQCPGFMCTYKEENMTVSERVELVKFDEPKYLEDGKAVVGQRKEAEDLAQVLHDQGYSNIFLLGIGGTEFEFGHYEYLMSRMSDVDVYAVNAADVNTVRPKKLNKDSLVITASSSFIHLAA